MRFFLAALITAVLSAGAVFAQEGDVNFKVSGEVKTGMFWYSQQHEQEKPETGGFIHSTEDDNFASGSYKILASNQGRFRLNMQLEKDNIGMKARFETTGWADPILRWGYAFAYGSFFDDQIKISAGKMGDSPWGSGGPEMWKELDTLIGMRFEFMPGFVPGLNFGFTLNDTDREIDLGITDGRTLEDILRESVLGVSYQHEYFLIRAAYRLDSKFDTGNDEEMIYRVEERIIQKYLPGFQIWANGYYTFPPSRQDVKDAGITDWGCVNWLYAQYDTEWFIGQIRLGYDYVQQRQVLYARPSYYHRFFNNLINVGVAFEFAQDFGIGKVDTSPPYLYWYIEPMVRLNLSNARLDLVYRFKADWETWKNDGNANTKVYSTVHWINLRMTYTF